MAEHVRERFALRADLTFLNHGSFGAVPRDVLAAAAARTAQMEADPVAFHVAAPEGIAAVRAQLAPAVGARPDDLALVENATAGTSVVLRSLRWRPGDRVVVTSHGYNAVTQALRWLAAREGVVVDVVPLPLDVAGPDDVVARVAARLPGARLLIVDAITSPTALVLPIPALIAAARREGALVHVDAAHAPGQIPLDLDGWGADFVTGNLHKWWFAPRGTALLWVHPAHQAIVSPLALSHPVNDGFPAAFDNVGTRDPVAWLTLLDAMAFMDGLGGVAHVMAKNRAACASAVAVMGDALGLRPLGPPSMRAAMASFPLPVPASAAGALYAALVARQVQVPVFPLDGRCLLRTSAQVYTTDDDVATLARVLPEAMAAAFS